MHAALWTTNGRVTFRAEGSDSGMIGTLPGAVDGTAVDVPSLRLRDIIAADANGRIDLLKLDIEGAEDAVLADCEPVLDRSARSSWTCTSSTRPIVRRRGCSSC